MRYDANTVPFPLLQPARMNFVAVCGLFVLRQPARGSKIGRTNRAVPGDASTTHSDLDLES
jgi:hypothetical protein